MTQRCVALLGQQDLPRDAVEDYCQYLSAALRAQGVSLEIARVGWKESGWRQALGELEKQAKERENEWFVVQYTALAWSRRGFPLRVVKVLRTLRKNGARCAVVFHDAHPYGGKRIIDRIRRRVQVYTMRKAFGLADFVVLTVPADKVAWLPAEKQHAVFIPVGANLPAPEKAWPQEKSSAAGPPTVAVFCVTGEHMQQEVEEIAGAVCYAAERVGKIRLVVFGRNAEQAEGLFCERLSGAPVELIVRGVVEDQEVVRLLGDADVSLFVRGAISTRRGSAIAAIACGLPVIACAGPETDDTITGAGVVLLPAGARNEFGAALLRILTDREYREALMERSRQAQERCFSWTAIAAQYAEALRSPGRIGRS